MDSTIDMVAFEKIVSKFSNTKEEFQNFMELPLADKQTIILDYQNEQKLKEEKSAGASLRKSFKGLSNSLTSLLKTRSEPALHEIKQVEELTVEELTFYDIIADSISLGDEKRKSELMELSVTQKHALLDGYKNMGIKGRMSTIVQTGKSRSASKLISLKKTEKELPNLELVPKGDNQSKPSPRELDGDEAIIFKMIVDDNSNGVKNVSDMYTNLTYDQKHGILNGFLLSQESLKLPTDLPFDTSLLGWVVNFSSVSSNLLLKYGFWCHLKKEHNADPLNFALEVNRMEDAINNESIYMFDSLVKTYVLDKSPNELNFSGSVKGELLHTIKDHIPGVWEYDATPRRLLEPLKFAIMSDLRLDPWVRFLQTKAGFLCVANNFKDSGVISKDPKHAVRFKLERLVRNTMKFDLGTLACNLSDPKLLEMNYLNLDVLKTLEFSDLIQNTLKGSSDDYKEDTSELLSNSFDKEEMAKGNITSLSLKLKLVFLQVDKKANARTKITTLLSPIMEMTRFPSDEYQLALMIGPWLFSFDQNELLIPKRIVGAKTLISFDIDEIECGDKFNEMIQKIATITSHWNASRTFISRDKNPVKHSDCQDFVEEILVALGSTKSLSNDHFPEIITVFKKQGTSSMKLAIDAEFQFQFGYKKAFVEFPDHKSLDKFMEFVFMTEPLFDTYFLREYLILKAFDAVYWRRNAFLSSEVENLQITLSAIEENMKQRKDLGKTFTEPLKLQKNEMDKKIKEYRAEYHRTLSDTCCCFGDPLAQSEDI
jgi:hypothetical protein